MRSWHLSSRLPCWHKLHLLSDTAACHAVILNIKTGILLKHPRPPNHPTAFVYCEASHTSSLHMNILRPVTGGLPLLLAALDKDRSAAIAASVVLKALLRGNDCNTPNSNPQMCSSLLHMGAVERLSQLLQPIIEVEDRVKAEDPGEHQSCLVLALIYVAVT